MVVAYIVTVNGDTAVTHIVETRNEVDNRGFTACGTEKANRLPWLSFQIDVGQHGVTTGKIAEGHV